MAPQKIDVVDLTRVHRCRQIILDETNEDTTVNDPVLGRHVSTTQISPEWYARLSVKLTAVLRAEAKRPTISRIEMEILYIHRIAFCSPPWL